MFKIFKPKSRLKADDEYKTKPQLAVEILQAVKALGFEVELVLAHSLYGESGDGINTIEQFGWSYILLSIVTSEKSSSVRGAKRAISKSLKEQQNTLIELIVGSS